MKELFQQLSNLFNFSEEHRLAHQRGPEKVEPIEAAEAAEAGEDQDDSPESTSNKGREMAAKDVKILASQLQDKWVEENATDFFEQGDYEACVAMYKDPSKFNQQIRHAMLVLSGNRSNEERTNANFREISEEIAEIAKAPEFTSAVLDYMYAYKMGNDPVRIPVAKKLLSAIGKKGNEKIRQFIANELDVS